MYIFIYEFFVQIESLSGELNNHTDPWQSKQGEKPPLQSRHINPLTLIVGGQTTPLLYFRGILSYVSVLPYQMVKDLFLFILNWNFGYLL